MMLNKIIVFFISILTFFLLFQAKIPSIPGQWAHSPHAESMNTAEERISMNKTGCAHCHTAQGYWEVILKGKKSTAPYKNAVGIKCIACHFSDQGAGLRAGSVKKACTGCHNILVQNEPKGFSSCPQGSLVKGKGGVEFSGKTYPSGKHSQVEKNCAGCHMAKSPGECFNKVGGHTFRVISKEGQGSTSKKEKPRIFNANGCTGCHKSISYEFVKKSQAKFKKLLEILAELLPQKEKKNSKKPGENPRFPADPSLSKVEAMTSYNYYQVLKDGTLGVHNPRYIKKLLQDSIDALKTTPSKKHP